jgi:transcriptional regulator with XRE-family HTH domain
MVATTPAATLKLRPGWGAIRATSGLSLRAFEARTGINRGELSRIERGLACPTPDQARRILAAADAI